LFRSTGFKGKQFVFLAAGSEPEQTLVFSIDKMRELMENNPGYAKYMINTRKVLVRIPPDQEGSMGFIRSRFGRHGDFLYDFQVHTADRSGKNQIFFNIYPILMEFLKVFNHSCVPVSSLSELDSRTFWQGPPLDLTRILNGIGRNAAQIVKQFIVFRQGHSFRLNYQVTSLNETEIELCGEAHPEVKIWKGFRIMDVTRRIRFRAADSILIFDQFSIEVRNSRNFGGLARVMLKLIE
jgi:hypothetical protein